MLQEQHTVHEQADFEAMNAERRARDAKVACFWSSSVHARIRARILTGRNKRLDRLR